MLSNSSYRKQDLKDWVGIWVFYQRIHSIKYPKKLIDVSSVPKYIFLFLFLSSR